VIYAAGVRCGMPKRMKLTKLPIEKQRRIHKLDYFRSRHEKTRLRDNLEDAKNYRIGRYPKSSYWGWDREHPEAVTARVKLYHAVKSGKIIKPTTCQRCGGSGKIYGHHEDYDNPLNVWWLCKCCHQRRHRGYEKDMSVNEFISNERWVQEPVWVLRKGKNQKRRSQIKALKG